jgi:hypothetical protein
VDIELPPDAPTVEYFAGRVTSDEGDVLSNFEIDAVPREGQYGKAYHLSFPLDPGSYTVDVVGGAAAAPVVTESFDIDVEEVPETGTWLSPLWLGLSAAPNEKATLGEPYTFGGWHLVPITGPDLTRENEIVFFGFAVRPGLTEEGTVELKARIRVKRDGKNLGRPLNMPVEASKVFGDLYMFGSSIGLSGLPETGPYEFEFEVTEASSDVSTEISLPVDISD